MIDQKTHSRILDLNPLLKELAAADPGKLFAPATCILIRCCQRDVHAPSSCRLANAPHEARAVAQDDIEPIALPPGSFKQLFSQLELFGNQVFNQFSERLTELMKLVTAVAFQKREQHLASLLLSRSNPIEMTHQSIVDERDSAMRNFVSL